MDRQYLDYLLCEWANYHYHNQIETIGYQKTSSTHRACKALEMGIVVIPADVYIDKTPNYISQIDSALNHLNDNYRQVIAMEYLGEGRRKDKVKKMNMTSDAYRGRLCRACKQLMNVLGG